MNIRKGWRFWGLGAVCTVFAPLHTFAADNGLYSVYSIGVEGFYDRYREPSGDLTDNSGYGSLTGRYEFGGPNGFIIFDGRVSRETFDHYRSWQPNAAGIYSGTQDGEPEWESELRLRGGPTLKFWNGKLSPYLGVGVRYYLDEGKGTVTSTGAFGYDRRIEQVYVPVGATYSFALTDDWLNSINFEIDPLVYGNVNSRIETYGGQYSQDNIYNKQTEGIGFRGEYMIGQGYENFAWQAGPFVRYWYVKDSDFQSAPNLPQGYGYYEPQNERLQVGAALRFLW